jgi:hypothetical protein
VLRRFKFVFVTGFVVALGMAGTAAAAAAAAPSADYRFENNFNSSGGDAKSLVPEGPIRMCPPCAGFEKVKVNGKKQGVWGWPEGDGLRLNKANKVLGRGGDTYTFSMLVNLDTVDGYNKLVDFDNREEDEGWYVYEESLYPYDLSDFDYSKTPIQAGEWHQIVLTRGHGFARGYVDGKLLGKDRDPNTEVALGTQNILHFLIDDGGSEQSGGMIARLRIWEEALDKGDVKDLGD